MNNLSVGNSLFAKPTIGRSEYGRVKVALAPGKGFMDWLRLTTNKALAKRQPGVDHNELAKHDKKHDCWVHLFGIVYDVTQYLDFHPGGIPELLRGAGRDATPLFNQYHAWVNYESLLKACIVGPFTGDLSKLKPCLPPTTDEKNPRNLKSKTSTSSYQDSSRISYIEDGVTIENDEWTTLSDENVIVSLLDTSSDKPKIVNDEEEISAENEVVRIVVRHFYKPSIVYCFHPSSIEKSRKLKVKITSKRIQVTVPRLADEKVSDKWKPIPNPEGTFYNKFETDSISKINHDTMLFSISIPENIRYRIPVGHHVSVKIRKGNAVLYRLYTPIQTNCRNSLDLNSSFDLMIKIYADGICTPSLENLKIGDSIEISDPMGNNSFSEWIKNVDELILLSGGTGITPMIDILKMRIDNTREDASKNTYLLMFNKTESNLQTNEKAIEFGWILSKWIQEYENDQNIVIRNILSNPPDNDSSCLHGRITSDLLRSVITTSSESKTTRRAFACGPNGFLLAVRKSLEEFGIKSDDTHFFDG